MKLILLFTYQVTLDMWVKSGLVERELAFYEHMIRNGLEQVALMTYGEQDGEYQGRFSGFEVLPKIVKNTRLYGLVAPLVHRRAFAETNVIKTNQSSGGTVGVIAKILFPRKVFVMRCGWVRTEEMMRRDEELNGFGLTWAKFLEWLGFRFADAIIVTTASDKDYVRKTYGIPSETIRVFPNSVDTKLFAPSKDPLALIKPLKVISLGRFVEMKNFQGLIESLDGLGQDIELSLIGDGPYRSELERVAERASITVNFVGRIPNDQIPDYLRAADIFVMPQFYGSGMSKVILEAMACGLVTIASDIRPHREVLEDGINGFLCGTTPHELRACFERVLALSSEELQSIATQARQDVLAKYSMATIAKQELSMFSELCQIN
ncbi:MAG: glycosyltransferase family 1 protein [Chloroflexi bacterium]|nr:MAG: glycosyltransferase family 1 protein [Chloroflexota bacterium]MBL1193167.1 glycosyltransferase family 1 protein [Chloroflexota bacterium]NOH10460.1 glycosyltransferase family 4 protein [Chloroflexota bacterium]